MNLACKLAQKFGLSFAESSSLLSGVIRGLLNAELLKYQRDLLIK